MPGGDTARLYHRLTSYEPEREWTTPIVRHALVRVGPAPGGQATTLVTRGIPWRTGWQYAARGFRHIYWDAGARDRGGRGGRSARDTVPHFVAALADLDALDDRGYREAQLDGRDRRGPPARGRLRAGRGRPGRPVAVVAPQQR